MTVELLKPLRNTIHVCAFARLHIYIFRESYHSNQSQKTLLNDLKCFILSCKPAHVANTFHKYYSGNIIEAQNECFVTH